jgi:spore coat polysaccharide biosynthesis protein SpsF (cytidylyltransferase family)
MHRGSAEDVLIQFQNQPDKVRGEMVVIIEGK